MTDDKPQPQVWVKVAEAHALKTIMGLVLVVCSGLSLVILTLGAVWPTFTDREVTDISQSYLTLLGTNLGVIFGGIIGFLSGEAVTKKKNGETISEGDMTLRVDQPPPSNPVETPPAP